MLSYCEYLAIKKANPEEDCYIENLIYSISQCNEVICQWNGYELEKIFGIKPRNIKEICTEEQWDEIIKSVTESEFWKKNWNYPVWITKAFQQSAIDLVNIRGDFEDPSSPKMFEGERNIKSMLRDTYLGNLLERFIYKSRSQQYINKKNEVNRLFIKSSENLFTGQRLAFKYRGNRIEEIDQEIRSTFVFPALEDEKNLEMERIINNCNAVAIHARRGDMLGYNAPLYKFGYFKRAVRYIKAKVDDPVFIFFCDPGSVEWCRENERVFGLNFSKDKVLFTDWNKGEESFRDMQLMSFCKHAIITNSSFGWWGAFLNDNPNKITCSPNITINTTHHF
ncbi:alpha-1,2-fucosyltransferase [Paenibacillus rhizovicinus]|uniref:Alpha-1,2-fucosyltransferase n=2 Tax=Paenibacillus rhizovicinus TaxID=2704463 RepID=A0A6C0PBE0_9BACL|nr:alpha-1,2-fucosyltransferase [Paenibacillus rhizovicinus]